MTKCVLGDLMEVTRGASLAGKYYATAGDKIRLTLANFDYANNCFKPDTSKDNVFYTQAVDDRFVLKEGDIITPLTEQTPGLLGTTARIPESGKYIQSQDVALLKPFTEKLDPDYCFYLVSSKAVRNQLGAMSQQTKIRHSSPDKIKSCTVFLPELEKQRRIGAFLSAIDRKIALNRKRIATLEAMAKEIYDYWFVQFDFPDAHGRPYKSSGGAMVYNPDLKREIPKGWEVCRIGDHITANRGISYSTKNISSGNGVPMINLNSFNVDSSYKVKGIKMFDGEIPSTRRIAPYDLVMCNTQQTDLDPCKDIIGKSFLVPDIFEGTIVSSHHVTTIHVDDDNLKVYLNALFHTREFHAYIAGYASGTSIRGLNFLGVENCYIAVPHMPLLSKFANLALSCEKEKSRILRNQKMLQALRDFILPLLMNGQAKVG